MKAQGHVVVRTMISVSQSLTQAIFELCWRVHQFGEELIIGRRIIGLQAIVQVSVRTRLKTTREPTASASSEPTRSNLLPW